MNPSSRDQPPRSHVGPRTTGGMASKVSTPATPGHGQTLEKDKDSAMATQPKMMDAHGAVGKQFTAGGAVGGVAQAIGGPLAEDGVIGKQVCLIRGGVLGGDVVLTEVVYGVRGGWGDGAEDDGWGEGGFLGGGTLEGWMDGGCMISCIEKEGGEL